MSDPTEPSTQRKELLKELILGLHQGATPEQTRGKLVRMLGQIPYGDVVQVEQELIAEGLPQEAVLDLCDAHHAALSGQIDLSGVKPAPPGHPIHTFTQENLALERLIGEARDLFAAIEGLPAGADVAPFIAALQAIFASLWEVDKHYRRKEYLLFPFVEKHGVTGPPTVMWGKHDQTRALLKSSVDAIALADVASLEDLRSLCKLSFRPAVESVANMIPKETQILFPMCLDLLTDSEWLEIARQSPEVGFCLVDPQQTWQPENLPAAESPAAPNGRIVFPTGSLAVTELLALFNSLPLDVTFVDKEDTVRYFSQGTDRIFPRDRAVIGRQVQFCHPPKSVHIVNQILSDFRSGAQDKAEFWLTLGGKFVHISYLALRDEQRQYLGCLEITQDLNHYRGLQGERRLLQYETDGAAARV